MCRLVIYKGRKPILLADLLTRPAHSIINQSFDARLRVDIRRPINGDGFGVGYYPDPCISSEPAIFTAITPAWNNLNLERLASKTRSRLVFGHVRASTAGVLAETNCHPWSYHDYLFMHNGGSGPADMTGWLILTGSIGSFPKIKRKLQNALREPYFLLVQGSTDSEWAFALFLNCLHDLDVDPSASVAGGIPHRILREAVVSMISLINMWTNAVDSEEPSLLNFAVTDGHTVVCTRYVSSKTDEAASLYFSSGTSFLEYAPGQYRMDRRDKGQDMVLVASEPLTFERADWVLVATNTVLTIHGQNVLIHPIRDQNLVTSPYHTRSMVFATSKGLY